MKHLGLFEGIGGFSLAARWMGWETVAWCEWNEFCQKVLRFHFPEAEGFVDITKTDFTKYANRIDILTGGFPCQPYSQAGKRKGKADDRHLWPEMLRAIREVQPSWVVGENVPGLLNWQRGMVLDEIKADLEASGFEVFPPLVLPACGKDAPHRRDRLWIIGFNSANTYSGSKDSIRRNNEEVCGLQDEECRTENSTPIFRRKDQTIITNTNSYQRCEGGLHQARCEKAERYISPLNALSDEWITWENFPTQPPLCGGNDGVSFELHIINGIKNENKSSNKEGKSETDFIIWETMRKMWEQREFAEASPELFFNGLCNSLSILPCKSGSIGWIQEDKKEKELYNMWESFYSMSYKEAQHLQKRMLEYYWKIERRKKVEKATRTDRIKAIGNSIVPQVAYEIFKAINEIDYDSL